MPEADNIKNSPLREIVFIKKPVYWIAKYLVDHGFTADQISIGGFIAHIIAMIAVAIDSQKEPQNRAPPIVSASSLAVTAFPDAVDGMAANIAGTHNPELDSGLDRWSEFFNHILIMLTNPEARHMALAALIADPFPAILRAYGEKRNKYIKEFDIGALPIRKLLAILALIWPEKAKQLLLAETAASSITSVKRALAKDKKIDPHDEKAPIIAQEGGHRLKMLAGFAVITAGLGIALNIYLDKKKPK